MAKCLLLTKVLVADGIMTENERLLLEQTMNRAQLTAEERRRVFDLEGWDDAEAEVRKLPDEERREVINLLMEAATVDGRMSPLEFAAIKAITKALELDGA